MKTNMRILDVGCGYASMHTKRGNLGVDINKGKCDIVADAHHLPLKEGVIDKVLLYAILEHLNDPLKCIEECKRVSKSFTKFEILIPIDARTNMVWLKSLIAEFPFRVITIFRFWHRSLVRRKIKKFEHPHVTWIKPKDIARILKISKLEFQGSPHIWFTILRKVGVKVRNAPKINSGRNFYIEATLKS